MAVAGDYTLGMPGDRPHVPYEQLFDLSLSAISVHTLVVDAEGRPVDYVFDAVNQRFESFTGLQGPDILGKTVKAVMPETEAFWIERYGKVALTGEPQTFTSFSQELGKWYSVSAFQHKPMGFTVSFLDITDIKQAEELVHRSREQFRLMIWNMQVGVLLQGPQAEILMANPRALELLGLTEDQLLGKTSFDPDWKVIHEDGSDFPGPMHPVPRAIEKRAAERNVIMGVYRPLLGDVAWLLVDAEPLFDSLGRVEQVVCTFIDISQRKLAETQRQESEERMARVLAGSQLGYWDWNLETGEVYRNPRWAQMLGYTFEEIALNVATWTDLLHPDDRARVIGALDDHLEGRTTIYRTEYRMLGKDGCYRWVLDQATIVKRDALGRPLQMSGTHTDITEQKLAQEEQQRLQARLQQAQKMENLGRLAGGVAHDMNNVLAAILTLASAKMLRLPVDDPLRPAFETISTAAERGGKLVKSLLEFARQSPIEEKLLDFNTLIREEVSLLEGSAISQVTLELELEADLPLIQGDPSALAHAVMNLCVNAVDAMSAHGTLTLRTLHREAGWVDVEIQDTGTGMTKDVLEKALDPFFTTKPVGKGTGLGLSLAFSTIQAHRGQLEIESQPGLGTLIRLRFPVAPAGLVLNPPGQDSRVATSSPSSLVLLVDDDEMILDSLREILLSQGHRVLVALSGEEALSQLEKGVNPDLVILDRNMPGLGGDATLARLKAARPLLPVLLSTGRADQSALDLVGQHPHVALLSKPFRADQLDQAMGKIRS